MSTTTSFAFPYGIRPARDPRPAIRNRPLLYNMIRSPPPASKDLAVKPIPILKISKLSPQRSCLCQSNSFANITKLTSIDDNFTS